MEEVTDLVSSLSIILTASSSRTLPSSLKDIEGSLMLRLSLIGVALMLVGITGPTAGLPLDRMEKPPNHRKFTFLQAPNLNFEAGNNFQPSVIALGAGVWKGVAITVFGVGIAGTLGVIPSKPVPPTIGVFSPPNKGVSCWLIAKRFLASWTTKKVEKINI